MARKVSGGLIAVGVVVVVGGLALAGAAVSMLTSGSARKQATKAVVDDAIDVAVETAQETAQDAGDAAAAAWESGKSWVKNSLSYWGVG